MNINDGGSFSKDMLARILAAKKGSMSEDELQEIEAIPEEAAQMGMGLAGSVKPLSPMAQGIKDAAAKTSVKWVPTAEQALDDAVKQEFKDAPKNFFEKFGPKAMQVQGENISPEEAKKLKDVFSTIKNAVKKNGQ